MRFDCFDDPDGASSGDEEYSLPKENAVLETKDDEEEIGGISVADSGFSFPKRNCSFRSLFDELDIRDIDIAVGQTYESKKDLLVRLKILSVVQKFDFYVPESRPTLYIVKCWVRGCQWRVRASTIGDSPIFHVRIYQRQHSCSVTERSARSRKATPDILAFLYKEFVGGIGSGVVANHVAASLNLRYGIKMGYWKGHRTLKCARELVRGSYESGYSELPSYLYMIRRENPGTLTRLEVDELDRFKSVFIAFGGKYLGTLLMATTQDGNYNIFPLAFAVVDTENDDSWEWFFRQLSRVIQDDEGLAIISDRHKSIGKAIGKVYPLASRGICTYHLHKNILVRFKGSETFGLVKKAATAYRLQDFDELFHQIHQVNPDLHAYLVQADVSKWSRVHFPGDRYNLTTTNIAESLNNVLKAARQYPIVSLLEEIRMMLTRWFAARRKQATLMTTVLTTQVEELLQARVVRASLLDVQEIDQNQYEVRSGPNMHVVNLSQKKCSCRMFDVDKIPCIHAIAAAQTANVSRISKCHQYFRTEYLRLGYAKSVMPKDESCPLPNNVVEKIVKTPPVRTQSGRPKLTRAKGPYEIAMQSKRPRKAHCCGNCGHTEHNRQTCNV
ncbi:PREDICTED: uncharacterized protein LOC104759155 [Camelina sativa]|uniref:Uncharacterized protein LOC104759155 n=1 Tax=Camelina sativa TaxID=90675 RepID=A0ABM0X4B5_CAMSA|nr:PREDICTED: uncharacterized protein LOC104759155 [Camelina sativa]